METITEITEINDTKTSDKKPSERYIASKMGTIEAIMVTLAQGITTCLM